MDNGGDPRDLVFPVYLDVPMIVSFLAAVEDGVAFQGETTERQTSGSEKSRSGKSALGIPALSSLLRLDMSGEISSTGATGEERELRAVRQHTEASLFNRLRGALKADGLVKTISSASDLASLTDGDLVEVTGAVIGNPLETILEWFTKVMPYAGMSEEQIMNPKKSNPAKSGNPQVRAGDVTDDDSEGIRLMLMVRDELRAADLRDIVLEGPDGVQAVLTLAKDFLTPRTSQYLMAGNYTVLGKVALVLAEGEKINLARRTIMGTAQPSVITEVVKAIDEIDDVDIKVGEPFIKPPALQVVPLSVFV